MVYDWGSKIAVLLASHNSEKFIDAQLHSVAESAPPGTTIYISDDGSIDRTREIVEAFQAKTEDHYKQFLAVNYSVRRGLHANFAALFEMATNTDKQIFFLCDHDDIWFADKVNESLAALYPSSAHLSVEGLAPRLIFSDLSVIDEFGNLIADSFADYQGLPPPGIQDLETLLHQNVVTGCTCCFNRELLEVAYPIPSSVVMHDHWLALCAKVFGSWQYLDEPLVGYRQHGSNAVGAKRHNYNRVFQWVNPVFLRALIIFPQHLAQSVEQATALLARMEQYKDRVCDFDYKTVKRFASLKSLPLVERVRVGLGTIFAGKRGFERFYLLFVMVSLPLMRVRHDSNK